MFKSAKLIIMIRYALPERMCARLCTVAKSLEKLGRFLDFGTISQTPVKYENLPISYISQKFPKISPENSVFQ